MKIIRPLSLSLIGTIAALLSSCDRGEGDSPEAKVSPPTAEEISRVAATGQAAVMKLKTTLVGLLKGALEAGGPVAAIQMCHQAAAPLTTAAGGGVDGVVSIRRTTLKPRNPANAPDATDRAVLEKMAATMKDKSDAPPEPVVEWQDGVARYYQPLMIQEICLQCHGDPKSFAPELVKTLADTYPKDLATGYALGDLRGVIRVDIDRP